MTNEEREKKHDILNKLANLTKIASALGEEIDDEQTKFISETVKLVLMSGSSAEHSRLFSEHIINFLYELEMMEGHKDPKEYLTQEFNKCLN